MQVGVLIWSGFWGVRWVGVLGVLLRAAFFGSLLELGGAVLRLMLRTIFVTSFGGFRWHPAAACFLR